MSKIILRTCVYLVFLYYGLAWEETSNVFPSDSDGTHSMSALPSYADIGICSIMVKSFGYPCEEHMVTTQDGYILSMQRIPKGRSTVAQVVNVPVLLQHGIVMDGSSWLLNSPDESLGYILADHGFDVWIANTRGTRFSRGHTSLSSNQPAYWEWSWDELVAYELPALVQYVYNQTSQKLHYVGHSLGTLVALASFSQNKLVDKLRSAALLCPIAYLNQIPSPLIHYAVGIFVAEEEYLLGIRELDPKGPFASAFLKLVCNNPGVNCYKYFTSAFSGKDCCLNSSTFNFFIETQLQSTSTKNSIHISQMVRHGTIAMFDYEIGNIQHYGQNFPPLYDMTSIPNDFPLYISYGGQDGFSDIRDVQVLLDNLKGHNHDKLVIQYQKDYAHLDFIMAVNVNQTVYNPLMDFLRRQ